jgi:hypothetical protein
MHTPRSFVFACLALLFTAGFSGKASATSNTAAGLCSAGGNHYTTIQAAVNAAELLPTPRIVRVCPGTYPEQVLITGSLTLEGVSSGNSGAAIITAPVGGMVANATSTYGGPAIEAQVLVQNTTATVQDLTMDASGSNLASLGCAGYPIGIFYQNASGTITRNSVINDILSATADGGLTGCQSGLGIYIESGATSGPPNPSVAGTSTVTVSYNNVANYQKNGITGNATGTDVTISDNVVVGQGPWNGAGQNSIQIAFGATGSVKGNTVGSDVWAPDVFGDTGDAAAGILVGYGSENIVISTNQVSNTQYGIAVEGYTGDGAGDGAMVTGNTITLTHLYDAIELCANNTTATGNKITGADESGIHIDDTCFGAATGNTVSSNTISATCAGVLSGPNASGNTVGTNTYYNTVTHSMTGSDTCTPSATSAIAKRVAKHHLRLSPAKP